MMRSFLAKHRYPRPSQLFNSPVFGRDKLAETGTLGYQEKKISELRLDKSPARKCWNIAIPWVDWFGDTMFGHVCSWTLSIYIYIYNYTYIWHTIQIRSIFGVANWCAVVPSSCRFYECYSVVFHQTIILEDLLPSETGRTFHCRSSVKV